MLDVLILAAGRGRRLRPLTDATPKPLLRVGDTTLLARNLLQLRAQGFNHIVINLAWRGAQIAAQIGCGARFGLRVLYSHETAGALGTGGGVKNALPLIRSDPFIIINADICTDYAFARLHLAAADAAHLVVVPNPPAHKNGDFGLRGSRLCAAKNSAPTYTYAGIGCFRREMFTAERNRRFELPPLLNKTIAAGRASGELYCGRWLDVGSHETLRQARQLIAATS